MAVGVVMLAAGSARRFGSDKRLTRMPSGETLLEASLSNYLRIAGACTVVVDQDDEALASQLRAAGAAVVHVDSRARPRGMGDSLAAGVREIARQGSEACLIALADMPWIRAETLLAIIAVLAEHPLVVPAWRGQWGHPVGFSAGFFPELCRLAGDRGARTLVERHVAERYVLSVPDRGVVMDVDTPADLRSGSG